VLLLPEGARVVTIVTTGGSFRVTFKPTNKVEIFEQVSKLPLPISFHLSLVAVLKFKKKNRTKIQVAMAAAIAPAFP
jgi:hypothetical protein